MAKQIWVSPTKDGWKVKVSDSKKAIKTFKQKSGAVRKGIAIAKKSKAELFVQKKDGAIGWKNSYGHDPFPPKG